MRLDHHDTLALLALLLEKEPQSPRPDGFRVRLQRLQNLVGKTEKAEFSLAALSREVFTGVSPESLRETLRQFRVSLADASEAVGVKFSIVRPNARKGALADEIICHFTGTPLPSAKGSVTRESILTLNQTGLEAPRSLPDVIRIFVSFSTKDETEMNALVDMLKKTWGTRRAHQIDFWVFHDPQKGGLLTGEDNVPRVRQEIATCPLGLILFSPDYMASEFIRDHELSAYFPDVPGKYPVLVNLRNSGPNSPHLPPEAPKKFIFSLERQSFAEMRGKNRKEQFAMALNDHIEALCRKHFSFSQPEETPATPAPTLRERLDCLVPPHEGENTEPIPVDYETDGGSGIDTVQDLLAWSMEPRRAHYFALLGEVGSGKTTAALMFARELNARQGRVQAYYFDMRYANYDGLLDRTGKRPRLDQVIDSILTRHGNSKAKPSDYIHAVREHRAVLIFDGLDEIFVSLNENEQDALMKELLGALPLSAVGKDGAGKLLLACRTHYFRSHIAERGSFTLQGREGIDMELRGEGSRASIEKARMLPFGESQIKAYFEANLPSVPFEKIWSLLSEIHNLRELATRPYLLNLIRRQLPALNDKLERNEKIRSVNLYHGFTQDWGHERNKFHNIISAEDKLVIMGRLAAYLWRQEKKTLPAGELETWLLDSLVSHPRWAVIYADDLKAARIEGIVSDFRTASFIARWDGELFRFAHTSLQEYFLACHLVTALDEGKPDDWLTPRINRETLDFAAELFIQRSGDSAAAKARLERNLAELFAEAVPGRSENALAFYLRLHATGESNWAPEEASLHHLDLVGWKFVGWPGNPLRLPKADFTGTSLVRCEFRHGELDGSVWQDADLSSAEFLECSLEAAAFSSASRMTCMEGSILRNCRLNNSIVTGADGRGIRVELPIWDQETEKAWREEFIIADGALSEEFHPNAQWAFGHRNSVMKVACFPCGSWIASGSLDGTVRIWDATNGDCARNLEGHSDGVNDVAISPNGKLLASAGRDARMILWEVSSGKQLHIIKTGSDSPHCACFSGDGKSLFVGGMYEGFHVYNVETGEFIFKPTGNLHSSFLGSVIHVDRADDTLFCSHNIRNFLSLSIGADDQGILFEGHEKQLRSISVSPRDPVVASSGDDRIVRIWNKHTGAVISELDYHQKGVDVVAFSPDGALLISGSGDGSVCIWDSRSWRNIATLDIGKSVKSVAFFPDGKRLAVASDLSIQIWDLERRIMLREIRGSHKPTSCIAYSHSGTKLASGTWFGSVSVWDGIQGKRILRTVPPVRQISSVIFLPGDSDLLFASTNGEIGVIDAADGTTRFIHQGHAEAVYALASDRNGSLIASASTDKTVKLWDAKTGASIRELEQTDQMIKSLSISPDGKWIVGGGSGNHQLQNLVCIWDSSSGKLTTLDKNHLNSVNALAVSPDSRFLASSAFRGEIYCWELGTGSLLHTISEGPRTVSHLGFSADGRHILALSRDMNLRSWDFEKGVPIEVGAEELEHFQKGVMSSGLDLQWRPFVLSSFGTIRLLTSGICELDIYEDRKGDFAVLEKKGRDYQWRLVRANGEYWRYVNYATEGPEGRVLWSADLLGPVPEV